MVQSIIAPLAYYVPFTLCLSSFIQPDIEKPHFSFTPHKVVISVPVADMSSSFPPVHAPALSPEMARCRRAHQGLLNETFTCIFSCGNAGKICCNTIVYGMDEHNNPRSTFWINKNNLIYLDECADIAHAIPGTNDQQMILALTYPWRNLSIGTRLVRIPTYDADATYAVLLPDYVHKKVTIEHIPRTDALIIAQRSPQEARLLFVQLINQLINRMALQPDLVIPYVWGGSSFVHGYPKDGFYLKYGAWQHYNDYWPHSGYDCSELIMRMAQLAGIDFPWKTSQVMSEQCSLLKRDDKLEEGDIIWFPGHVIIVSDIAHNQIIEARGYGSGYGCVHRLQLHECFDGIDTYNQLLDIYYAQEPLFLCTKNGEIKRLPIFKILKLIKYS